MDEVRKQVFMDLLVNADNNAFEVMVDQMNVNPDVIEALYGDYYEVFPSLGIW